MNRRHIAAAGAAVAALFVGGVTVNETLLSASLSCASVAVGGSWNTAYVNSQPGCDVPVAAGSYPSQSIAYLVGRDTAAQVRFVPQGNVTINGNLDVQASGVYVDGTATGTMADWRSRTFSITVTSTVNVTSKSPTQIARNVTLEGIDSKNLLTLTTQNTVARDMDVGPSLLDYNGSCTRPENKIGVNGSALPTVGSNITWERVAVHDQNRTQAAQAGGCHYGGLFVVTGSDYKILDSVFAANHIYNIQVQNFTGPAVFNARIEDTDFDCPVNRVDEGATCLGQPSVQFNSTSLYKDWTFLRNTFTRADSIAGGNFRASFQNVLIQESSGPKPRNDVCPRAGVTFKFNQWTNGTCGSEDGQPAPPTTTDTTTTTTEPPTTTTDPPTTTVEPPTTTTEPPAPTYNLNAEYDRLEATTTHERWRKANPNEAVKVEAYWRSGGTKPSAASGYGVFLVNAAEELRR